MINLINIKVFRNIATTIGSLAIFYGMAYLISTIVTFVPPHDFIDGAVFYIKLFFNGVVLPILGYIGRRDLIKMYHLVKNIHDTLEAQHIALNKQNTELDEIRKAVTELNKDLKVRKLVQIKKV